MIFSTVIRAFCIGATLSAVSGQRLGRDPLDKCWTCEQSAGCFECLSMIENTDGTSTIELDFSGCKDADTIGWACCTGSSGADGVFNEGFCEVPRSGCFGDDNMARDPDNKSPKCEGVSSMFVVVPSGATSVVINTHDGRTGNDASPAVGADPICAGREFQGGRCAKRRSGITAHCLETIDLSTCPTAIALPSELPSDVPTDMPSVMTNESDPPSLVPAPEDGN